MAIIEEARSRVVRTVNRELVLSNWHIGREIVEYVQRGEPRVEYGKEAIKDLSRQLLTRLGKGYSARNLWYFRHFYVTHRDRAPSIRAERFPHEPRAEFEARRRVKMPHEAGVEFAEVFSARLS